MANRNPITTRFTEGNTFGKRWQPGESGNPRGISALQREWRLTYANALITIGARDTGSLAEAATNVAKIVWAAALKHEAWAVRELVEAIGGARALQIKMELTRGQDEPDYDLSKLTDAELDLFIELAARARAIGGVSNAAARLIEGGEGAPPAA